MTTFEEKKIEFIKKGQKERIAWLENMHKIILPSHLQRIKENDKTILKETVFPEWVSWEMLREWAEKH